jgi:adenine C2-methylase RlmN of 23S rRNA A2503 and tRNA A37
VARAADGTRKLVFRLTCGEGAGGSVETVLIPVVREQGKKPRVTVCVSSQVRRAGTGAACQGGARAGGRALSGVLRRQSWQGDGWSGWSAAPRHRAARRASGWCCLLTPCLPAAAAPQVGCAMNCQFCYTGEFRATNVREW